MDGLILETSTEKGCIVLARKGLPVAYRFLAGGAELSKTLALEVDRLLDKRRPAYVAVGTGPGSYTGIRVGAALGKALSFGWGVPLFGFCSLESFLTNEASCSLVDARMGGFYLLKNSLELPALLSLDEAKTVLPQLPLIASPHPKTIQKRLPWLTQLIETSPDPKRLAALSYRLFLEGNQPPITLSYLSTP